MKFIFSILAAAMLCGCEKKLHKMSPGDQLSLDARRAFFTEITNVTVGLRSINETWFNDSDGNITNWHAGATVEFINHFGGIDRTNLNFIFRQVKYDWSTQSFVNCYLATMNPDSIYRK